MARSFKGRGRSGGRRTTSRVARSSRGQRSVSRRTASRAPQTVRLVIQTTPAPAPSPFAGVSLAAETAKKKGMF